MNNSTLRDLSCPPNGLPLSIERASPFLRAVLLTDGTLTNLLSCLLNDNIVAQALPPQHWIFTPPQALFDYASHLGLVAEPLQIRSMQLQTEQSQQQIAVTHSVLHTAALPVQFAAALSRTPAGLGQALRNERIEHYRQLFWYGLIPKNDLNLADATITSLSPYLPARAYGIFIANQLVMTIAECFIDPRFGYFDEILAVTPAK